MKEVRISDIAIIIVVYNTSILECNTFKSLNNIELESNKKLNIIIYDNSPEKQTVKDTGHISIISYFHDRNNSGISIAYNLSAKTADNMNFKYLLFFDQDTTLPKYAMNSYLNAINLYIHIPLYAPILQSHGKIISPAKYKFKRGSLPGKLTIGINSLKYLSPLNSGICVSINIFKDVGGYNELIPLDYSDFEFISRIKTKISSFIIVDITLGHKLSSFEIQTFEIALFRFKTLCTGLFRSNKGPLNLFFSYIVALRRCINLIYIYRDCKFLTVFLNETLCPLRKGISTRK